MKVEVVNPDEEPRSEAGAAADPKAAEAGAAPQHEVEAQAIDPEPVGDGEGAGKAAAQGDSVAPDDPVSSADEAFSLEDLRLAREEAAQAKERCMRLEAEWDNFRKRTAREREQERTRASEDLVSRLLPVVDDMERALDHAATQQPDGPFGQFVDGVGAVYTKLRGVLEKTGVECLDPVGEPFDMNIHQAVAHVEDASVYDETVRDVYQKGYRMGGKVIRPAMVTVTKGGPARPAQDAQGSDAQ